MCFMEECPAPHTSRLKWVPYFAGKCELYIRKSSFFFSFQYYLIPSLPCLWLCVPCRETQGLPHQYTHRRIISHADELPPTCCSHRRSTCRDSARLMSKREKVKIQNRDREGALSSLFPWGWIISCRCC